MPPCRARARGLRIALALSSLLLAAGCARAPEAPEVVVLVVVDTLRADQLGAYGQPEPTSPQLDRWLASARLYEKAFATSSWTLPSFGSLFTGHLPSRHGAGEVLRRERPRSFAPLDPALPTLAEQLAAAGWHTAALINNPFLAPSFRVDRGFAYYDAAPTRKASYRRAEEVVDEALAQLDAHAGERLFLLVHIFDPHLNYDAPEPFRGLFSSAHASKLSLPVSALHEIRSGELDLGPEDHAFIAAAYREEIAYTDRELGRLLAGLEERGVLERGLVILTSDHGEELFEHGGFEHGHAMWNEVLRIPLAFWGRGIRPGREAAPVSLADVPVTILDALAMEPPEGAAGRSLWRNLYAASALPPRTLIAEGTLYGRDMKAILRWPHKLVVETLDPAQRHLFDLEADPREREDLAARRASLAEDLLAELMDAVQEGALARSRSQPVDMGEETREQLRSLGYLD